MRRRDLLAGLAGLGTVGGGAAVAVHGVPFGQSDRADRVDPLDLPVIVAPDEETPDRMTIPREGEVTFLEIFATWCGICQEMMPDLAAVHEQVGDDVQFVSVTYEPVGQSVEEDYVREWWADHGGRWPVAHDADLKLTGRVDANVVPYSFIFDESNRLVWRHRGDVDQETLEERIDEQL